MITLITVADSWQHFRHPIEEYQKRLGKSVRYVQIRPEKISSGQTSQIVRRETERIIEALKKQKGTVILCDEHGKTYTTRALHTFITQKIQLGELIFIIGGSYGVDHTLLAPYVNDILRMSDFTLPHGLAYLTLLEQIYRVMMIEKGSSYHHE